jgi:SAM-dependent methyltransferase
MKQIIKNVNAVYSQQNPSTYIDSDKKNKLEIFLRNKKNFLVSLKLVPKLFKNSSLIDLGCGSGQNSLVYDHLGSKCTLVEYDLKSCENAKNLFDKYAKNEFKIINSDLFKVKFKKKFDFVISNGVAHHTKDIKKNINIGCNLLNKNGFFLLGVANLSGYFQRNLQRYILYKTSDNKEEIVKNALTFFKSHIERAVKYGGRKKLEVIYDSYLKPKIEAISVNEIKKIFNKNNIKLYSSYYQIKSISDFLNTNLNQFQAVNQKTKNGNHNKIIQDIYFSEFQNFSLSNNFKSNINLSSFSKANKLLQSISSCINDVALDNCNIKNKKLIKKLNSYKKIINKIYKFEILDKKHNSNFLKEVIEIISILNNKKIKKNEKKLEIKKSLRKAEYIFKGVSGTGMDYYVGFKN